MAFIHDTKIILTEYNFYNQPGTKYEHWTHDNVHRVFMFANLRDHTNCMVKVNYPEFVEANTP